jgi:hypothetical protein
VNFFFFELPLDVPFYFISFHLSNQEETARHRVLLSQSHDQEFHVLTEPEGSSPTSQNPTILIYHGKR